MDTKDKDFELASPREMMLDTTMSPLVIENEATNGQVRQVVGPDEELIVIPGQKPKKSPTPLQDSLRRLRRDKRAMASLGVIILFILLPIFGPVIYQHIGGIDNSVLSGKIGPNVYHSPYHIELDRQDELFSGQYWLGTDGVGRDLFARLMLGMLVSITVALLVEIVDVVLGITVGVLAGFYGGWIDQLLARLSETQACGFEELFADITDRAGLIVTFISLLEMIRLKLVRVFQSGTFGPIRVYKRSRPSDAPHPIGDPEAHRG